MLENDISFPGERARGEVLRLRLALEALQQPPSERLLEPIRWAGPLFLARRVREQEILSFPRFSPPQRGQAVQRHLEGLGEPRRSRADNQNAQQPVELDGVSQPVRVLFRGEPALPDEVGTEPLFLGVVDSLQPAQKINRRVPNVGVRPGCPKAFKARPQPLLIRPF